MLKRFKPIGVEYDVILVRLIKAAVATTVSVALFSHFKLIARLLCNEAKDHGEEAARIMVKWKILWSMIAVRDRHS